LVPSEIRNFANGEVRRGNPDLIPAFARNFDLLFEHYFKREVTFSVGFFYKNIDNFIFQQKSIITDDAIVENFQLIQSVNGATADVYGVEVHFQMRRLITILVIGSILRACKNEKAIKNEFSADYAKAKIDTA